MRPRHGRERGGSQEEQRSRDDMPLRSSSLRKFWNMLPRRRARTSSNPRPSDSGATPPCASSPPPQLSLCALPPRMLCTPGWGPCCCCCHWLLPACCAHCLVCSSLGVLIACCAHCLLCSLLVVLTACCAHCLVWSLLGVVIAWCAQVPPGLPLLAFHWAMPLLARARAWPHRPLPALPPRTSAVSPSQHPLTCPCSP